MTADADKSKRDERDRDDETRRSRSRIAQTRRRTPDPSNAFLRVPASPREKPSNPNHARDRKGSEDHEEPCPPIQLVPSAEVERRRHRAEDESADYGRE